MVVSVQGGRIGRIVSFNDDTLFPAFGLPAVYPGTARGHSASAAGLGPDPRS
jgi:hypothetical protein